MDPKFLFNLMVERNISYFHLIPGSPIMFREKTLFAPLDSNTLTPQNINEFAEKILTPEQKKELYSKKEFSFIYSIPGVSRFTVNLFMQRGTLAIIMRMNPINPPSLDKLGIPDMFKNLVLNTKGGLIIFTGPKKSGKSFTLASIVDYILEMRSCQIISVENPIEFLHKNKKGVICQREIGIDTPSFEEALKSLSQQSADVLVVTEINSVQTAQQILNLATGEQLILAVNQAPGIIILLEQLIDLFPTHLHAQAKTLFSIGLTAVISQTLCLNKAKDNFIPVFEILIASPQVKTLLREGKIFQLHTVMGTTGREIGMQTQEQALRTLVKKNLVDFEEAQSKAIRPEEFKKIMSLPY